MSLEPSNLRNRLLRAVSAEDFSRYLEPALKPVTFVPRQRLQLANLRIERVYFLESGVAAVLAQSLDRRQAEVAISGADGMSGWQLALGVERCNFDILTLIAGNGYELSASAVRKIMAASPSFNACVLRYAHAFAVQCANSALVNAHGKICERVARWLLMVQDSAGGAELSITHETIAMMLGVRRAGVTTTLLDYAAKGLISSSRATITINDRRGLELCTNGLYRPTDE